MKYLFEIQFDTDVTNHLKLYASVSDNEITRALGGTVFSCGGDGSRNDLALAQEIALDRAAEELEPRLRTMLVAYQKGACL